MVIVCWQQFQLFPSNRVIPRFAQDNLAAETSKMEGTPYSLVLMISLDPSWYIWSTAHLNTHHIIRNFDCVMCLLQIM